QLPAQGALAASDTWLAIAGEEMLFATGVPAARVFHSLDSGRTWTAAETPIASGKASAGIFSLTIGDDNRVMAVGGDYKEPSRPYRVAAHSVDGGKSWQLASQQPGGYRSAVAHIDDGRWVAVGPSVENETTIPSFLSRCENLLRRLPCQIFRTPIMNLLRTRASKTIRIPRLFCRLPIAAPFFKALPPRPQPAQSRSPGPPGRAAQQPPAISTPSARKSKNATTNPSSACRIGSGSHPSLPKIAA